MSEPATTDHVDELKAADAVQQKQIDTNSFWSKAGVGGSALALLAAALMTFLTNYNSTGKLPTVPVDVTVHVVDMPALTIKEMPSPPAPAKVLIDPSLLTPDQLKAVAKPSTGLVAPK